MDVWSLEEIEECRALLYPSEDATNVVSRWDKWGGVVDYVLEKTDPEDQDDIEEAIARCSILIVEQTLGGSSSLPDVSDLLLHLKVEDGFTKSRMEWASAWVAERFAAKAWKNEKDRLLSFTAVSTQLPMFGSVMGSLWEGLCHAKLVEGGKFLIRCLDSPSDEVEEIDIERCDCRYFDDLHQVKNADHKTYWRPRTKTLPAIDSLRQPGELYQIITAERHDINYVGVKKAMAVMQATGSEVRLYFVVPPGIFASFKKQLLKGTGAGETLNVKQFVLGISLE